MVKAYYISSIESLMRDYEEMKCLADFHNARVMINLNKRSYEKLAFQNLLKVTNQIMNKDYKNVKKSYNSVVGQFSNDNEKKWIIDIDNKDIGFVTKVVNELNNLKCSIIPIIYGTITTKNGYHLITSPFNRLMADTGVLTGLDIHKDNPTILYVNN